MLTLKDVANINLQVSEFSKTAGLSDAEVEKLVNVINNYDYKPHASEILDFSTELPVKLAVATICLLIKDKYDEEHFEECPSEIIETALAVGEKFASTVGPNSAFVPSCKDMLGNFLGHYIQNYISCFAGIENPYWLRSDTIENGVYINVFSDKDAALDIEIGSYDGETIEKFRDKVIKGRLFGGLEDCKITMYVLDSNAKKELLELQDIKENISEFNDRLKDILGKYKHDKKYVENI